MRKTIDKYVQKQDEFLEIYNPVKTNLEKYAIVLTGNSQDAKDLIHDTILEAYEGFDKIKSREAFLSYLFTIAKRNYYKKKRRLSLFTKENPLSEPVSKDLTPEESIDLIFIYKAINKLNKKYKDAFILHEIMGMKIKEIADIESTTESNIKVRIHRAKIQLKKILDIKE